MQVIIYHNESGGVSIVTPSPEFSNQIELVALKDVPNGRPWRIVDEADLPSRDFRDRWMWTDSGPLAVSLPSDEELYATKAAEVRARRDYLLQSEVDPIVSNPLRWASMPAEKQGEWVAYRQALLDIPQQDGFPANVDWPVKPE